MKLIFPLSLGLLLVACAPPKPPQPGTDAHQRLLAEEARKNFYVLQAQHRKTHPQPRIASTEAPTQVRLKPFASEPAPEKRSAWGSLFGSSKPQSEPRQTNGTIYTKPAPTTKRQKPVTAAKPTPAPKRVASVKTQPKPTPKPARFAAKVAPKPRKPTESINPFGRYERNRRSDETIYYSDIPRGREPNSSRYQAYKAKYARSLAKRPEDLTPEEREWVLRHYRD
jgi:hypothetical protein